MVNSAYYEVVRETVKQLNNIMNVSLSDRLKDVIKKVLGRSVRTKDPFFWHAGMLMLGLGSALEYLDKAEDSKEIRKEIENALESHVNLWIKKTGGRISFVDDALAGFVLIKAYDITGNEKYKRAADAVKTYLESAARDAEGAILYNTGRSGNIFADGIGQVSMFMAASVDKTLDSNEQLKLFYKYGMDEASGLPYHGYELKRSTSGDGYISEKKGILSWGRAFGWLIMGASANASCKKSNDKTYAEFKVLCESALKYQRKDGGWSWQMQAVDGHIDMSATGMIAFSLGYAVKSNVFGEDDIADRIRKALKKAEECIYAHSKDGIVIDALSSCDDFAVHYQTYGNYPWGQGAALAALSVII